MISSVGIAGSDAGQGQPTKDYSLLRHFPWNRWQPYQSTGNCPDATGRSAGRSVPAQALVVAPVVSTSSTSTIRSPFNRALRRIERRVGRYRAFLPISAV